MFLLAFCLQGVETENDFNWLAQLRYYWENNTVMVRITNSLVKYAYEYLGNSFRYLRNLYLQNCNRCSPRGVTLDHPSFKLFIQ